MPITTCHVHVMASHQVTRHGNLAYVISRCGTPLLHNNLESIMITLFKLVYKVRLVNKKSRSILCVTNPLAKKYLFYLNIGIVLPKTSQLCTPIEVQCFQLWYAHDKITWKFNQALGFAQEQHLDPRKLQDHISL